MLSKYIIWRVSSSFWLHWLFIDLFRLYQAACRILVPWPGIEPGPWQWEHGVLTTEPPGNSLNWLLITHPQAGSFFLPGRFVLSPPSASSSLRLTHLHTCSYSQALPRAELDELEVWRREESLLCGWTARRTPPHTGKTQHSPLLRSHPLLRLTAPKNCRQNLDTRVPSSKTGLKLCCQCLEIPNICWTKNIALLFRTGLGHTVGRSCSPPTPARLLDEVCHREEPQRSRRRWPGSNPTGRTGVGHHFIPASFLPNSRKGLPSALQKAKEKRLSGLVIRPHFWNATRGKHGGSMWISEHLAQPGVYPLLPWVCALSFAARSGGEREPRAQACVLEPPGPAWGSGCNLAGSPHWLIPCPRLRVPGKTSPEGCCSCSWLSPSMQSLKVTPSHLNLRNRSW